MRYDPLEENARQEALYAYLLSRGDNWTHARQVTDSVSLYPTFNPKKYYHNSAARRYLTRDIKVINDSARYEMIIIHGDKGIKLANEEEFEAFLKNETDEALKKLCYCRRLAKKGSADQQYTLEGKILEVFTDG